MCEETCYERCTVTYNTYFILLKIKNESIEDYLFSFFTDCMFWIVSFFRFFLFVVRLYAAHTYRKPSNSKMFSYCSFLRLVQNVKYVYKLIAIHVLNRYLCLTAITKMDIKKKSAWTILLLNDIKFVVLNTQTMTLPPIPFALKIHMQHPWMNYI